MSTLRVLIVISSATILTSCAAVKYPKNPDGTIQTLSTTQEANSSPIKVQRFFQSKSVLLDSLPIGSIVPLFSDGVSPLPENWRYANGDVVKDDDSPLNGIKLPTLHDNRFLMGTEVLVGGKGGSSRIPPTPSHSHVTTITDHSETTGSSGSHDHEGETGFENSNGQNLEVKGENDELVRLPVLDHKHDIKRDGSHHHDLQLTHNVNSTEHSGHDHGGDNRPKWFGVYYIIKIK